MWITDWTARAACKGTDPDELFVQGAAQNRAKLICRGCTVRTECLADALDNRIEFGVWGGMTERERRLAEHFVAAHPSVPVAEIPARPEDVHDLAGLRAIGESLAGENPAAQPAG